MKAEREQQTIGDMEPVALHATPPEPTARDSTPRAVSGVFKTTPVSERSWHNLYEDHAAHVWRTLRRLGLAEFDAKDALHEVFLVAHLRAASYDPARGSEKAWLFGIACNVARSERRRLQRVSLGPPSDWELTQRSDSPPALSEASKRATDGTACTESGELRVLLARAINKLSPEHRVVFEMFEMEGLSCAAIADEMDIPVGTVYSRLHHARQELRTTLRTQRAQHGPERSRR